MGLIELRLGDDDMKEYAPEGAPEWTPHDREALDDAPFDVLRPWEKEIRQTDDTSIQKLVYVEFPSATGIGIKAAVWLSWKMSGLDTPSWAEFNLKPNRVRWHSSEDDADPPASGSSEPSPETDTTTETTTPSTESLPS